ncbi:hypothetical protein [Paenibacillus validus]|uniref:hypothetical protein n=1 Tax=Paenibacillus validus TaxID=44253 RepID=UPI003D283F87
MDWSEVRLRCDPREFSSVEHRRTAAAKGRSDRRRPLRKAWTTFLSILPPT